MWDSRDRAQHYTKKYWPLPEELVPGKERNVINDPLVDRDRILFPPLHIKLGLIKQFNKALDRDGDCFTYLCQAFPGLTMEKLKAGIFYGPQIRHIIRDPDFENSLNEVELEAWKAFILIVKNFLGNNKARNLDWKMSVKMHYLFSNMDRFPENLGSMSGEPGEIFHQDLKEMKTRYQGRWDTVMMADYCWNLKKDLPVAEHSRSSKKRKFKPWSLNNGEATCNLRVLTFINTHNSLHSNRCFNQVINICCWQNIFSLKNIFRMICVDKNQLIMPQKCNRFCQKIWFFSNQSRKKTWPDGEKCHFLIQQCKNTLNQLWKSRQHSKSKKLSPSVIHTAHSKTFRNFDPLRETLSVELVLSNYWNIGIFSPHFCHISNCCEL